VEGFSERYILCSYDEEKRAILVRNGFETSDSELDPPKLRFTIPFLRNPRAVTNETGAFNVTIFNIDERILYVYNSSYGPNVSIYEVQPPERIEMERSSLVNGELHNMTFQITSNAEMYDGDRIAITVPVPLRFSVKSRMIGAGYWIEEELETRFSFDQRTIYGILRVSYRRNLEDSDEEDEYEGLL